MTTKSDVRAAARLWAQARRIAKLTGKHADRVLAERAHDAYKRTRAAAVAS